MLKRIPAFRTFADKSQPFVMGLALPLVIHAEEESSINNVDMISTFNILSY